MSRRICLVMMTAALLAASAVCAAPATPLADNPSPYIAMHAADPVAWRPWGRAVLDEARREHKLVFVAVGYYSCRWCHVMQRESFQNPRIAALINKYYVPVVVDRELNPGLDTRLQEFVQATQGYSGWPLNVFLTPRGYPLVGAVYLPPKEFQNLLESLHARWEKQSASLERLAQQAARDMAPPPALENNPHLAPSLGHDYETALVEHALKKADTFQGGFGNQSKFPAAPQLLALLDAYARGPEARLGGFLQLTLDQMASQGLHDQLGGGFFRYAVDPGWQQPHFEKMLYDNALLAEVYLAAARVLHRPAYAAVARDTLDFMLRAMSTRRGAFVSSLSAVDGHGKDGGYYLWDRKAFRDALSPAQWRVAQRYWRLDSLPGGDLPLAGERAEQIAATLKLPEAQVAARVAAARRALLEVRSRRTLPRDDKVIAGWNGLALSALCRAAALPGGEKYRAAAQRLRDYLVHEMWNGTRLLRARVGGKPAGEGALEDYAYVAQGLAAWARLTHSRRDDALARALVLQGWKRFHVSGGWHLTQDDLLPYGATDPVLPDTALPSPSAVLARVTLALAARGADTKLRQQALAALNADSDLVASESYWFATQIAAVADYQSQAAGGGAAHR